MLYFARFEDAHDVLVDAADADAAIAQLDKVGAGEPTELVEVPAGVFCAEIRFADDDDGDDGEDALPNPARQSQLGCALEPYEDCTGWLAQNTSGGEWDEDGDEDDDAEDEEGEP